MNLNQVTIPAIDMEETAAFYRKLGFLQIVDTPHYARFECPEGDATFSLSLIENHHQINPTTIYFETELLEEKVNQISALGIDIAQPPTAERYLWTEAIVYDPSGNKIKLYWAGDNRKNPPWRVERRD